MDQYCMSIGVYTNNLPSLQRNEISVRYSPGLVDFVIGLVNSVFNLPEGKVMSFEEYEEQKNCEIHFASQKVFGLVEMTSDLVNASCKNDFLCTLLPSEIKTCLPEEG